MKKRMSTGSALPDENRLLEYKRFAVVFSYPDESLFDLFPDLSSKKDELVSGYDDLFRAKGIWLYGTEHLAKNDFQKSNYLSDIMGFYRAFGLEPHRDRPDSLANELEFIHYLIFKKLNASRYKDKEEKEAISLDAQKKFFSQHLYPAAKKISEKILSQGNGDFYSQMAKELLEFLESEKRFFRRV